MLSALASAIKDRDLRKKIFFTLGIIILYRIGAQIPSPGVDYPKLRGLLDTAMTGDNAQLYSLVNLFSGGALLQLSVFAIGIMPYITASIIVQLLTVVIPYFEQLKKEGQSGQAKMTQYTRYLTIALAVLQSAGIVALADRGQLLGNGQSVLMDGDILTLITIVTVMTAGAALVMWFGELITDRGVGNGMSLLIFAGIASRLPAEGVNIYQNSSMLKFAAVMLAVVLIVVAVVFVEQGQRRIPVQYAKRMVGRRQYGGTSTYLPLKVNQAGVIPVIFASSLMYVPILITQLIQGPEAASDGFWQRYVMQYLQNPSSWGYILLYFALIIFFAYFYVAIQFDPMEQAENMKKYGGFIPGIRPGRPTAEYLGYVLNRILLFGSLYLGLIAVLPNVFLDMGSGGGDMQNMPFGGTAVLIMVSVGLDTVKQIEAQLMQRNYEGFLK
ncbi:preprotein translocase subunit SecY [Dietzia sp. UBA5065]|uniref:preprotein translocase subunit SecY n=1 Tax=Dietzia sp. UBA5065 TaxID=1946422 RepID=UPI0025C0B8E4|nr:preprotein translocase subunit SecY [Dietzia sp. UBA5065]HMT48968.1 preprotein translocase subunit SecY [Dietzia sp.]